jgi:hypothetical protein
MEKVEVFKTNVADFKTNVADHRHAKMLVDRIHESFMHYQANFDLEDCDKILRVKCAGELVEASCLIKLLNELGFNAEILPDE